LQLALFSKFYSNPSKINKNWWLKLGFDELTFNGKKNYRNLKKWPGLFFELATPHFF
jgi:hypothetical protein